MNTLQRYLLRNNLLYMFLSLGVALGIYLLIDIFDRLDEFIQASLGARTVLVYFLAKIPFIVSQVLPAVFLLSLLIQLGLMRRARELTALQTGGVSLVRIGLFFLMYSLLWCAVQLTLSEFLGVEGDKKTKTIWREQVRKRSKLDDVIWDVWFKDENRVVHVGSIFPEEGRGGDITVYVMANDFDRIEEVISSSSYFAESGAWVLQDALRFQPQQFTTTFLGQATVPIQLDPRSFLAVDPKARPETLPLWKLRSFITKLEATGSNVERLLTAYHMKWAYAFSLSVMVLVAMAMASLVGNIYLKVAAGLVLIFLYYGLFVMGGSLGENGVLPPWLGAWFANLLLGGLSLARLAWIFRPRSLAANPAVAV